jgi:putative hydrolase of the HAD superfamily
MTLRAVLFDVDGVLVHGYHARAERQRRWDEHMRADLGIDPDVFRGVFIKGPFEAEVLTGRLSLLTALERTLPAMGYGGSPLAVAGYWLTRDSQLNFQLLDIVRKLRRANRARLYIATNQEHMRAFHLWGRLGMETLFDDIFYSARLGVLKPDALFFQRIATALGPQAEPPLLFDDSMPVVEAARAFGWEGVLYDQLADCATHPWIAKTLESVP